MYTMIATYSFSDVHICNVFDKRSDAEKHMKQLYEKTIKENLKGTSPINLNKSYCNSSNALIVWNNGSKMEIKLYAVTDVNPYSPCQHGHDPYKVKELQNMLDYETDLQTEHYGAKLKHHAVSNVLTIDRGAIKALINYYSNHKTNLDADV